MSDKLPCGVDHRGKFFRRRWLTLPFTLHTCLGATAGCFGLYGNQESAETAKAMDRALRHKARFIGAEYVMVAAIQGVVTFGRTKPRLSPKGSDARESRTDSRQEAVYRLKDEKGAERFVRGHIGARRYPWPRLRRADSMASAGMASEATISIFAVSRNVLSCGAQALADRFLICRRPGRDFRRVVVTKAEEFHRSSPRSKTDFNPQLD
jgi:hypothetical protein